MISQNIPTDSLYKWGAISSVAVILLSFYCMYHLVATQNKLAVDTYKTLNDNYIKMDKKDYNEWAKVHKDHAMQQK